VAMGSPLHLLLARAREQDLRASAAASPRTRGRVDEAQLPVTTPVTLRYAFPDDAAALARLAALDSAEPPAMPALLCEAGGTLLAALSLADGSVVADPFHPTVALVELLRARARQLTTVRSAPRRSLRSIRAAFRARLRLQSDR
jgi:hypothetical protein